MKKRAIILAVLLLAGFTPGCARLERHPESFESFEPVQGRSLLYVTRRRDPSAVRCFLLDRPVVLDKGLWHGIVTLGREADVKITENNRVKCVYWKLGFSLGPQK